MAVAIIIARGGSKRIPRKNIREFMGKPIIAWSIEAALQSGVFSEVIVSTDDKEIAAVARDFGATTPFMRPAALSDDHTPTAPVLAHALRWLKEHDRLPEHACCIYPTAPFLHAEDIRRGLLELQSNGASSALSVTTFDFPILRAFRRCDDGSVAFNWPEHELTRSQDLPEFLHDAGQFYWVRTDFFLASERLIMPGARPVVLPRKRVQDLDTLEDWDRAEVMAPGIMGACHE